LDELFNFYDERNKGRFLRVRFKIFEGEELIDSALAMVEGLRGQLDKQVGRMRKIFLS